MNQKSEHKTKKEMILEAALEIFSVKGIEKGTVAEIADKADVGKGTIYHYFNSKEQIFTRLIDYFFANWMSEWDRILDSDNPPYQKLEILIDQTFNIYEEISEERSSKQMIILCEIIRYTLQKSFQQNTKAALPGLFRNLYGKLEPVIEKGIKEGIFINQDVEHLCFVAFGLLDGFSMHYLLQKDYYSMEKSREITKNILLNGLLKEDYKDNIKQRG